jgi:polyisoprenoid-binding protein YceI
MKPARSLIVAVPLMLAACASEPAAEPPLDGAGTLDPAASRISFVSVKAGEVAEPHYFDGLSGQVGADGAAEVTIDLASVETAVDIRNERMREMLFEVARFPQATASVQLDPAAMATLATGDTLVQPVTATLDLHGRESEVATELAVTRIAADKVQVQTVAPIIIDSRVYDLFGGIEQLREVAGLPGITPQVPVTLSLTFNRSAGE